MPTPTERPPTLLLWTDPEPHPGATNMAVDRALLGLSAGEGVVVLRLYRWDPFCLSFGRHEPAARRYDRARIATLGLDCVRRPTGGRAVWHARELTYAVTAPEAVLGGLREAYVEIHRWLATAIRGLGTAAELAGPPARTPRPGEGACFAAPVGGEILVQGFKVVGSAQVRDGGALLQHGSILLEDDQEMVRELGVPRDQGPPAERPLTALLGRRVGWDQAAAAVAAAARSHWPGPVRETDLTDRVQPGIAAWILQFRDPAWTWAR